MTTPFLREILKARRKPPRLPPTEKQLDGLGLRMERAMRTNVKGAIDKLGVDVPTGTLARAFAAGKYDQLGDKIPWARLGQHFGKAQDTIADTIGMSADVGKRAIQQGLAEKLNLASQNRAVNAFIDERTGALIQNIKDEAQVAIQGAVKSAIATKQSPDELADVIKQSIGLNSIQAAQYRNFVGTRRQKKELKERLLDQRALTIARTEVSFAVNRGQLAVWQAGMAQGIIPENAQKTWHTNDENACKVCDPMDEVAVAVDETFAMNDGAQLVSPPAHPRCRCLMSLTIPAADDSADEGDEGDEGDDE